MDAPTRTEPPNEAPAPVPISPKTQAPQGAFDSGSDPAQRRARERRRLLARRARRGALLLAIGAAAVAVVLALRPRPVPVDLATAARGPLVVAVEETGVTRVADRYVVSAPVAGSLSRLELEAGDAVKEGAVLAEIAPVTSPLLDERTRGEAEARLGAAVSALGQARAGIERARAALALAQKELVRARRLAGAGALPRQGLDQAELTAEMREDELSSALFAGKVAAEQVRLARAALGRSGAGGGRGRELEVRAPASGRVLRVHQESAAVVPAGAPLVEIGDPDKLEIVVDFLTTDAVRIQPGTEVTIRGWGREEALAGRVLRVEPSAFTRPSALGVDEQRVNVIIGLTGPREKWAALGDAFRVTARVILWQAADVLKVPLGAVFRYGDDWALYRAEERKARLTPVKIGHRGETEAQIVSGISAGDRVVVHPGDRVEAGARIEGR